jgi:sugar lactone lactonase YvrE
MRISVFVAALIAFTLLNQLCVRADDLYVSTVGVPFSSAKIRMISPSGADLRTFADMGSASSHEMVFDNQGNLYVTCDPTGQYSNTVHKFGPTGDNLGTFASAGLDNPQGIAFDSSGNLYVANLFNDSIREFSPTGVDLGIFAETAYPWGIAFDTRGNLLAANWQQGTIHKFGPSGTDLGTFATTGLNGIHDLAFDRDGNLFVSIALNSADGVGTIHRFSPDGADLGVFAHDLSDPVAIAFDSNGNLFVAEHAGSVKIREFGPNGADLGTFFDFRTIDGGTYPIGLAFKTVPEPATLTLMALGAIGLIAHRRYFTRRKAKSHSASLADVLMTTPGSSNRRPG